MIIPKFCIQGSDNKCSILNVKDITGNYSSENLGGYGTPNESKNNLHIIVRASYYNTTAYLDVTQTNDVFSIDVTRDDLVKIEIFHIYNKGVVTPTLNQFVYDTTTSTVEQVTNLSPLTYTTVTDYSVFTSSNAYLYFNFNYVIADCKIRKYKTEQLEKYFSKCSCKEKENIIKKINLINVLQEGYRLNFKLSNFEITSNMLKSVMSSCNKNCNCGC